jgi:hypothetical protein
VLSGTDSATSYDTARTAARTPARGTVYTAALDVPADQDTFTATVANPVQASPVALRFNAVAVGGIGVLQEVTAAYRVR